MSGQQIGSAIGLVVGAYFGMPQLGMAIGGLIGGAIDPTKINGPHLGDGQTQTATDGVPIAWVMGTATVAGTIVQVSKRREVKVKDSGKGSGTEVSHYEWRQDFAILVCESCELRDSTIDSIVMVQQDGKIVYDVRPGSKMLAQSAQWKANKDFLFGGEDQLPHPTLEAITGVGNTPAYRGSCIVVFKDFNITAAGNRIPTFQFTVASSSTHSTPTTLDTDDTTVANFIAREQANMVGRIQYFALSDDQLGNQIALDGFTLPDTARWVILPIYEDPAPTGGINISHTDAPNYTDIKGGIFDTGWLSDGNPVLGWEAWWTDQGKDVPDVTQATSATTPTAILNADPGRKLTGLKIITLVFGNGSESINYAISLREALNPSGVTLTYLQDGVYEDTATKRYYKTEWSTSTLGEVDDPDHLYLSDVISKICVRGGLTASQIDVADMASTEVVGYPIATQCTAADALAPLLQAYFAYGSEYDGKIHFKFYGADADVTVSDDDAIEGSDANEGAITKSVRNQATEFPYKITGSYYDPAQNYMPSNVTATRRAQGVIATGEQTFQIPVVMDANTAQQAVEKALKIAYAKLQGTQDFSVPFAATDNYITLCAGEPLLMDDKRWVVDEVTLGDGSIKLSTRYDRQSAYTSNVQAIVGIDPITPISPYSGPTTLIPMNLPSLRPQDTYGIYLAAASAIGSESWQGCTVQVSYDGQTSWQNAVVITIGSTLGRIADAEPSSGEPLTVDLGNTGDLDTVTADQIAARMNAFALVDGDTAEVCQFQTADLLSNGEYELTDITRGLLGTTESAAMLDQQFTMLDSVYFFPIDISFSGTLLAFRAVGFGEIAEDAAVVTITYNPDTTVIIDGGEVT